MTPQEKLVMELRLRIAHAGNNPSNRNVAAATGGAFNKDSIARIRDGGDVKMSNFLTACKAAGFEVVVREVVK